MFAARENLEGSGDMNRAWNNELAVNMLAVNMITAQNKKTVSQFKSVALIIK
jgi:hypothetical protein